MAQIVNSVWRLHGILAEAKYSTEGHTRVRLASALGVDPEDRVAFFRSVSQLFELVNEAEAQVQRLVEAITSDIDQELKILILDHLQEAHRAINEYRVRGVVRLREAGLLGLGTAVVINKLTINKSDGKSVDARQSLLQKYWGFVCALINVASTASKALPVVELVGKSLVS